MPRPKGTPNKPKEALDPGLANLATIALDMNLDESVRQEAAQALTKAMNPAPPEPAPTPHAESDDPFAGCKWPPAGHAGCVYDSHGNYPDSDTQGNVPCLVDPLHKHGIPFGKARAKYNHIDLDALDVLEKELGL